MSSFKIAVHDLMHKPGHMREVDPTFQLEQPLGAGLAIVPKGADIMLSLRLESVHEGIYVSGGLKTEAVACLLYTSDAADD